ncbi:MAG TPA: alpha-2-macroglobulin family protein, partial [Myxococcaceae bacterium]|nr:alpha-2-macroglobulin family protein [Myxococcaceae bacterium]
RVQPVKPVALWSGWVKLDGSGKATVPFQLPQYRGAVRVMAVAASAKKMGHASAAVLVRDPLVLQTTLPRFLTQGDTFQIPVFVTNLSGAPQEVTISLAAQNLALPGAVSSAGAMSPLQLLGKSEGRVHIDAGRSSTVVFQARAALPTGAAKLLVTAKAGNLSSREELDVPFQPPGPRERIVQALELGAGRHDLKRYLGGWIPGSERTSIWLTANPYAESFDHLTYLLQYPYGCIEQTTSSTRPLLFVSELIQRVDPTLTARGKLEDMVMHGVNRVLSMQTPSGGFGYWMGDPNPTAWGTAYATHMLLDAQKAGYAVPKERLDQVLGWIEQQVARFESGTRAEHGDHGWSTGAEPYMHFVLALAGRGQKARVLELIEERPAGTQRGAGAEAEERYMLQAALWLSGDRRYEKELKNPDSSPITAERRNDWSFYSDQRRRGFVLSTFQDLFGSAPEGEPLAARIAAQLRGHPSARYTTQELVWSVTGLGKRVSHFSREFKPGVLLANGKSMEAAPGRRGSERTWSLYRASEHQQLELDVKDAGKSGKLFAILSSEGVRQNANWRMGGEGLRLWRKYRAADGTEIDLRRPMALAELAFVEVEIANTTRERVQNVALVDRLPAGWEIENPRLGRGSAMAWVNAKELWQADFMNVRDDRVEVFGALAPGEHKKVVYGVRAVTSGLFTLPPVEAEAMYDPSIWAREPGGKVEIQGNWKEFLL